MVKGGDGYSMIPENLREHRNTGFLDGDLIVQYLRAHDPVRPPKQGRIVILNAASASSPSSASYAAAHSSSWPWLCFAAAAVELLAHQLA